MEDYKFTGFHSTQSTTQQAIYRLDLGFVLITAQMKEAVFSFSCLTERIVLLIRQKKQTNKKKTCSLSLQILIYGPGRAWVKISLLLFCDYQKTVLTQWNNHSLIISVLPNKETLLNERRRSPRIYNQVQLCSIQSPWITGQGYFYSYILLHEPFHRWHNYCAIISVRAQKGELCICDSKRGEKNVMLRSQKNDFANTEQLLPSSSNQQQDMGAHV